MDRRGGRDRSPIGDRLKRMSGLDEDARDTRDSRGPMENGFRRERQNENNEPLKIDREKTCPLLLRVFCQIGRHHKTDEFNRGRTPANELQIYTWKDATLKEIMGLVKEVNPEARRKGTYFDFAVVYPNFNRGGFMIKEVGTTCSGQKCPDDNVTLASKNFRIGDYLDISIVLPPKAVREGAI